MGTLEAEDSDNLDPLPGTPHKKKGGLISNRESLQDEVMILFFEIMIGITVCLKTWCFFSWCLPILTSKKKT